MRAVDLPFGEWLPDQPDYQNPGLVVANNAYPTTAGFGPFFAPTESTATTTEVVNGAANFFDRSGNAVACMGSATRLYTKRGNVVSETTGYMTTVDGWRFERFGDLAIAVSIQNAPQYLTDINTDDGWSALPGSPPKAAQIGRVGDFLVLGDLVDIDGLGNPEVPNRVRWGAFNNPTASWVTDRGELSDFRDLDPRYGRVTAIVGGRFGLVFQERAVWRMVFVGAPKVFEFEEVLVGQGCTASGSAVTIGAVTYFQSQNGFMRTNGSDYENIGSARISKWFGENLSETSDNLTNGAVNWPARSIVWAFRTGATSSGFDRLLIYNFVVNRWSYASLEVDYLVESKTDAQTLGDLGAQFTTLSDMAAFTLGNEAWRSKSLSFAAFCRSGSGSVFATMDGPALAAEFTTGDFQVDPNARATITGLWPVIETASADITCQSRTRAQHGGGVSVSKATKRGADGYCPQHTDGWLHSFRSIVPAGETWNKASGIRVRYVATGSR